MMSGENTTLYQTRPTLPEPVEAVRWDETMKRHTAWRVKP